MSPPQWDGLRDDGQLAPLKPRNIEEVVDQFDETIGRYPRILDLGQQILRDAGLFPRQL